MNPETTIKDFMMPFIKFMIAIGLILLANYVMLVYVISQIDWENVFKEPMAYEVRELKAVHEVKAQVIQKEMATPKVVVKRKDPRVVAIERYLKSIRSPLWKKANKFVEVSDKYNLPWWLLPSICVAESGCGKNVHRPYNPFGWGKVTFHSWDHAIETVGKRLRKGYFDKGCSDLDCIHQVYNGGYKNWIRNVLASKTRLNELYVIEKSK